MQFDPAIAAQHALHQAEEHGELGDFMSEIQEAEDTFSTDQSQPAKRAYERLQEFGARLPEARWFQEFLIYITWQQVTEETISRHFEKGLELCDRFLERFGPMLEGTASLKQVRDIRESFQGGLGIEAEDLMAEHDEDAFKGGD
jgi:hypothetical protein